MRIPDERDSDARRKAKRRAQTGDWGQDDVEVPLKTTAAKIIPGIPQLRRIVGQLTILSVDRTSRLVLSTLGQTKVSIVRSVGGESELLRLGDLRGGWGYGQPADAIWGLALGEYAAGKPNILVDATNGLRIRNFDADLIKLDLAGNADLSGKLLMRGASSAIAIGTTPPTSATVGTGIWIDRTGLYGLNVNVQQTYINNTGQIIAGAGAVSLDAGGIAVSLAAAPADERSYKFTFGGSVVSILQGYVDTTLNALNLTLNSVAGKDSVLSIAAAGGFGKQSRIILDCGVRLSLFGDLGRTVLMNNLRIQSGNLDWTVDNANDIGASGANRPRDLYLGGKLTLAGQIVSSLATGTAPLSVASTTKVTNLNADLLDGKDSTDFALLSGFSTAEGALAADVSLAAPNTFYDGPSVSLVSGTWLIVGTVTVQANENPPPNDNLVAKLWDGTTVKASTQKYFNQAPSEVGTLSLSGIVVLSATATWKISVAQQSGLAGKILAAATVNGAGNNASHIRAVKLG